MMIKIVIENKFYIFFKSEIWKKIIKKRPKNNQKHEDQNWHINKKTNFDWRVKLKRKITLTKKKNNKKNDD